MPNTSGKAYALTTLCPLKDKGENGELPVLYTRGMLEQLPQCEDLDQSPMAKVPNTYLARFFILDDAIFEGYPYHVDRLRSKYLVFACEFHGGLDPYIKGMYKAISGDIKKIWKYGVGFEQVSDENSFLSYIKKCQVETTFFFNGSNDCSLAEQLKSLYLKQEFSRFVFENQGKDPATLLNSFKQFIEMARPTDLNTPTWKAGGDDLKTIVI